MALILVLALFVPAEGGQTRPDALFREFQEAELKNFRIQGEGFSVSSARLKIRFAGGESGNAGPAGIEAAGLELRVKKHAGETAPALVRFFRQEASSMPEIWIEGGAVIFETAPTYVSGGGISFKSVSLLPGEDALYLEAEDLDFGEFQICALKAAVRPGENIFTFPDVSGVFAGGEFSGEAKVDIGERELFASGYFKDILVENLPGFSDGDISGRAGGMFELSGNPRMPDFMTARGSKRLEDGNIRGIPGFYGLAPAFLRSSYGDETFSEGELDFTLSEGVFTLQNVRLMSEDVRISGAGKVALDGRLDLVVESSLTGKHMRDRAAFVEVFTHILQICDYFIIRHRLTGTVKEPSYEPMPLPAVTMLPLQVRRILGFLLPMQTREMP